MTQPISDALRRAAKLIQNESDSLYDDETAYGLNSAARDLLRWADDYDATGKFGDCEEDE